MSAKRDRLIEAAERLFYREGYYATGIDRVIAEAGVARMTLYHHFASKEELVCAVLRHRAERYMRNLDEALVNAPATMSATADALLEAHGRWVAGGGDRGCMFMKALGEYAAHAPAVAEVARAHKHEITTRIRAHVDVPDQDAQRFAERMALILEGATTAAQIRSPEAAMMDARAVATSWLAAMRDGTFTDPECAP